jgi:hypothetical protein
MKHSTYSRFSLLRHFVAAAVATLSVASCTTSQPPTDEAVATTSSALFTNGGFETGAAGAAPPSWTVQTFLNAGVTVQTPQTRAGLNLQAGGVARTVTLASAGGPLSQPDPSLGAGASLRWPRYGNQCAIVNRQGNNQDVNSMSQTMTIGAGDVDPMDGQVHVRFVVAPVLQNPAHTLAQQPYYFVQLTDVTQNTILYTDFNLSGQPGIPWKTVNGGTANEIDYTDWQLVDIAPGSSRLAMGDMVKLEIIAGGCSLGAHFGQIYVDGTGGPAVPGLFVSGTGPAQANAGTNITYGLTYQNGGATGATGVTVYLVTPPNTTYQSLNAPGLTCVTPAVGAAGTVTCTVGNVAAGAGGSFQITLNINAGATGTLVEGNYAIQATGIPPLLGPHIVTQIGCTLDAQCSPGFWCDESANACTAKLANGMAVPSDPPHTNPTLNAMCTPAAGALVCTSSVCDAADNKCGYANGDGPCTVTNGATVCRSGACSVNGTCEPAGGCNVDADCTGGQWCDESMHMCTAKLANGTAVPSDPPHTNPTLNGTCTAQAGALVCTSSVCDTADNKCGYANGDGPCTVANGGTVCRSGACSVNGTCEPAGSCNVDADCSGGLWCDESMHGCTPQIVNGGAVPSDPPHTNPTLNGTCTSQAGALVCQSGVCDTKDNECGYANGDGPCTASSGGKVCRSSACSTNGVCEPAGGCNVDSDCTNPATPRCSPATHVCQAAASDGGMEGGSTRDGGDAGSIADAGPGDSGNTPDADAGERDSGAGDAGDAGNATTEPDAADQGGFVEGGGLSCTLGPNSPAPSQTLAGLLMGVGIALGARRRRR